MSFRENLVSMQALEQNGNLPGLEMRKSSNFLFYGREGPFYRIQELIGWNQKLFLGTPNCFFMESRRMNSINWPWTVSD